MRKKAEAKDNLESLEDVWKFILGICAIPSNTFDIFGIRAILSNPFGFQERILRALTISPKGIEGNTKLESVLRVHHDAARPQVGARNNVLQAVRGKLGSATNSNVLQFDLANIWPTLVHTCVLAAIGG